MIFRAFAVHPFSELTYRDIKRFTGEKSNNTLGKAISLFKEECIITERKVGRSSLLKMNTENNSSLHYIALLSHEQLDKNTRKSVTTLKKEIGKQTHFFTMAIFGSYASKQQKNDSDLDVVVITCDNRQKKLAETGLHSAEQKSILPIDAHVFTKDEFVEMLVNDEENLGKQIAKKHLAVHNHQLFYDVLKEGMKHGFRI